MSEMKHTPGPWKFTDGTITYTQFNIETEEYHHNGFIGEIGGGNQRNEEIKANAKLIAAAPDLLAACVEFVRKCECGEAWSTRSYNQMKEAIKKATA